MDSETLHPDGNNPTTFLYFGSQIKITVCLEISSGSWIETIECDNVGDLGP